MKKLIAILLSLTFILSVSAFAVTIIDSDTNDVYATYQKASDADKVYSVDIIWGDMHFNYKEASDGTWDPGSLKYTGSTLEGWYPENEATESSLASNEIRIVNKSNADLDLTFSFTPTADEINGVDYSFTRNGNTITGGWLALSAAIPGDESTPGNATTELLALNFEGTPNLLAPNYEDRKSVV